MLIEDILDVIVHWPNRMELEKSRILLLKFQLLLKLL